MSTSEETLALALAIVFAVLSFVWTTAFRRRLGRNPWGIHPNLWLVIGFLLGPIGAFLAFVSCAATRVGSPFRSVPTPTVSAAPASPAPWATAGGPPPGWYPDPSGRHEYRFFTGHDWTADVVDNGTRFTEPLTAPPAP